MACTPFPSRPKPRLRLRSYDNCSRESRTSVASVALKSEHMSLLVYSSCRSGSPHY